MKGGRKGRNRNERIGPKTGVGGRFDYLAIGHSARHTLDPGVGQWNRRSECGLTTCNFSISANRHLRFCFFSHSIPLLPTFLLLTLLPANKYHGNRVFHVSINIERILFEAHRKMRSLYGVCSDCTQPFAKICLGP